MKPAVKAIASTTPVILLTGWGQRLIAASSSETQFVKRQGHLVAVAKGMVESLQITDGLTAASGGFEGI